MLRFTRNGELRIGVYGVKVTADKLIFNDHSQPWVSPAMASGTRDEVLESMRNELKRMACQLHEGLREEIVEGIRPNAMALSRLIGLVERG